jgi:hypothetical protein
MPTMGDEEFDGEKTQFWLPGKDLPGRPTEGDAAGETAGSHISAEPDRPPQELALGASGDTSGDHSIDFDLTAEEPSGPTGLDFDVTAEEEASPGTLDFDITGQGASDAGPATRPPSDSSAASGGRLLFVGLVAIAGVVLYLMTR